MDKNLVSIVIPIHNMQDIFFFLKRCLDSVYSQTYTNYEVIITTDGRMAENTNSGIKKAKGDLIKILYVDDFFAHPNALQNIVDAWDGKWLVTGCNHTHGKDRFNDHYPIYQDNIYKENTIGSPSVLTLSSKDVLFDENLQWTLDCDLYKRLHEKYGEPTILNDINITIGIGEHQTTRVLTDEEKLKEVIYTKNKHEN